MRIWCNMGHTWLPWIHLAIFIITIAQNSRVPHFFGWDKTKAWVNLSCENLKQTWVIIGFPEFILQFSSLLLCKIVKFLILLAEITLRHKWILAVKILCWHWQGIDTSMCMIIKRQITFSSLLGGKGLKYTHILPSGVKPCFIISAQTSCAPE